MSNNTIQSEESKEEVADISDKKQKSWLFKKGKSGNPEGRPKGSKSLKTWAREYLAQMDEEERIEFLNKINPDLVWRMSEGNPVNEDSLKVTGTLDLNSLVNKANDNTREHTDDAELPEESTVLHTEDLEPGTTENKE